MKRFLVDLPGYPKEEVLAEGVDAAVAAYRNKHQVPLPVGGYGVDDLGPADGPAPAPPEA